MKIRHFINLLVTGSLLLLTAKALAAPPKTGDPAPAFSGQDQDGQAVNLADFTGKKIVLLYFYPKDNTPGCTKEACGFRDRLGSLQKDNVEVIGVSFDSAASHKQFIAEYKLNFRLLPDPDGKIADAYGVRIQGKNMAKRVSFLIGLDGKIVHVTDSGDPDKHFSEMQQAIAGLKKQ
ncbi:MAG TPA: peroxiredoxin [Candidatus Acidoferrum sp.]|nr:peroxiredoxin [Candidatus Acidoferrum sp.]